MERYSDSRGEYVHLKASDPTVYKTLFRAAKAKLKLRLRVTLDGDAIPSSTDGLPKASTKHAGVVPPPAPLPPSCLPAGSTTKPSIKELTPKPEQAPAPQSAPQRVLVDLTAERESSGPPPSARPPQGKDPQLASAAEQLLSSLRQNPPVTANLAVRSKDPLPTPAAPEMHWGVFCNNCEKPLQNEHWHCGSCDGGDYDLCVECVDSGVLCKGESHWIIKRALVNGQIVNSETERISPRPRPAVNQTGSSTLAEAPSVTKVNELAEPGHQEFGEPVRTCNHCLTSKSALVHATLWFLTAASLPRVSVCHVHRLRRLRSLH